MTPLEQIIRGQIERFGPMNLAEYMALCLLHPDHGYYITRQPLGAAGDFTTSPEISQMFGEMLGLCLAQAWQDQGSPERFALVEPGPGRGTLMADILRVGAHVPGFLTAAEIWLIEASPGLQATQAETLKTHSVNWAQQLSDLPELPIYLIANEFFDALPMRQFHRAKNGWQEQMIALDGDQLTFGLASALPIETLEDHANASAGSIVETSAATQAVVAELARRIADHGGAALVFDYGGWASHGDTFQAVRSHQKVDPLIDPGMADLTAHVDFAALARAATGISHSKMIAQGALLERLGITARAQVLAKTLEGGALENLIMAHRRLTHPSEMGSLFKAIALYPTDQQPPPGFDPYDP